MHKHKMAIIHFFETTLDKDATIAYGVAMQYKLNDKLPPMAFFLYSIQWWLVILPFVIIVGGVAARLHFADVAAQTWYLQKVFALLGITTVVQVLFGHRLPVTPGPASILLVGLTASVSSSVDSLYTAIFFGGCLLTVAGFCGLFSRLRSFFTSRIIAVVLVLIGFSLTPTILRLIFSGPVNLAVSHFCFALVGVTLLVGINNKLPGAAKSLTVLFGMAGGTLLYFYLWGFPEFSSESVNIAPLPWGISFEFDAGTVLAFTLCFLALSINELGAIEALGHMLRVEGMEQRIRIGSGITGFVNVLSGLFGVIGVVNYSLSAGVIGATRCASRYPLILAGILLTACAFFPGIVRILASIPGPVTGMMFLYLMTSQLASGLIVLMHDKGVVDFASGITVGLPLMISVLVSFVPAEVFAAFPELLRPVLGNAFVMGSLAVIFLEHVVFRNKS